MTKISNILKVPSFSQLSKDLMERINNKFLAKKNEVLVKPKNKEEKMILDTSKFLFIILDDLIMNFEDYKHKIKIITELSINSSNFQEINLNEIKKEDKFVILTLNPIDYLPSNILDFSLVFCPHCKER